MNKVYAPFDSLQIASINNYQMAGFVHPFTCANRDVGHDLDSVLEARTEGMVCAHCSYVQDWVWEHMADSSWEKLNPWYKK